MYRQLKLKRIKPRLAAYEEIVEAFKSCDKVIERMTRPSALIIKKAIDDNFVCSRASEYRQALYGSMSECGMIPIDRDTRKLYTLRDTQNLPADPENADVKLVRSIGKFYQLVRDLLEEYERPEPLIPITLDTLQALKAAVPNDPKWFQMTTEIEVYARENNLLRRPGRIKIKGNASSRTRAFIAFIAERHPVSKEIDYVFEDADYLVFRGRKGHSSMTLSSRGPVRVKIANTLGDAKMGRFFHFSAIAHEYYRVILEYRDKGVYRGRWDSDAELAADDFAHREIAAARDAGIIVLNDELDGGVPSQFQRPLAYPNVTVQGSIPKAAEAFINFFTRRHPVEKAVVYSIEDTEYIRFRGMRVDGLMCPSETGPVKLRIAGQKNLRTKMAKFWFFRVLAHEYCHVLRDYRDNAGYRGRYDRGEEDVCDKFAYAEITAAREAGVIVI